jgi:hypothetical protein
MYFLVKDHPASLEKIERNGKIVKVLGKGLMKSPGHPSGNQMYYRQSDILKAASTSPYVIPIYNMDKENKVEFLGKYKLHEFRMKESFEGFRYFEYTMMRVECSKPGVEPVFPPE